MQESAAELERKVEARTAELRAMQAHLVQAEKMAAIGKLSAGVAHEINNPLTGILTNSSLMLEDLPPDHPWREDVQTIVDETLRCRRIVKGLLDFARQTKPQRTTLAMNEVVEDVLALVRNQTVFRAIRIDYDFDPQLPAILADADQIRQVVLNIVLNAAEAMDGGGDLARVFTQPRRRTDDRTAFCGQRSRDSRRGAGPDLRTILHDQTHRHGAWPVHRLRHRRTSSRRIARRIDAGRGTTFVLVLPSQGSEDDDES